MGGADPRELASAVSVGFRKPRPGGCWPAASLRSRKMVAGERGERSCLLAGGQCKVSQNVAARGEFKVSQNWRVEGFAEWAELTRGSWRVR